MTSSRVRVGFDQKVRVPGSGSGIVYIMVLRLILWSFFVIPFHVRGQSLKVNVLLFRFNVDKELIYNQYIFISSTDSHASHPKEQCSSKETGIQSLEILWRQS